MFARAAVGAILGAILAPAALAILTAFNPSVAFEFDADLPRTVTSGFYPVERTPDQSFAWTSPLATVTLRGIDRSAAWRCAIEMRGSRPAGSPPATVLLGADGVTRLTHAPGAGYETVQVDVPAQRGASALTLTISTTPAFVPGASDTRELGIQVDRLECAPAGGGFVSAPAGALAGVTIAGAAFGAVFAVLSPTLIICLAANVTFVAALAFVLNTGVAAYSRSYVEWLTPLALWITAPMLAFGAYRFWRRRPLHPAAGFVLAFSSAVLFIKMATLLHPSKEVVDAVFHAHRLEWVLGGRYFFTQAMPGGVQFPYAIGLYVTAAPWASVVRDHVALLRLVVLVAEAIAAALLYVIVARTWSDRLAGAAAVVLYHTAPLPYAVIGNANLTYAFGQSISVIAVCAAAALTFGRGRLLSFVALFAIVSLAFLSHVGIFPLLAVTLTAAAGLYWWSGPPLRAAALAIVVTTFLAAAFATGAYYAHFPEVFATVNRVTAGSAVAPQPAPGVGDTQVRVQPALTMSARASRAVTLGIRDFGWPLLILAAVGAVMVTTTPRDRVNLTLAAWGASCLIFVLFRIVAPVDAVYQRYADEFIERVYYATLPAVAVLAGRTVAVGWRRASPWRLAAAVGAGAAVVIGGRQWIDWIR
jgi:hypothetical protein